MASMSNDVSIATAKQIVDWIVSNIETNFKKFNISEIVKAGSLGHGTAVPGHYDIDLVIYSRDISRMDVVRAGFGEWLEILKPFVQTTFNVVGTVRGGYNTRSLHFALYYRGVQVEVDLLVSPYWQSPDEFYNFLNINVRPEYRDMFTVCASKWQIDFFEKLKDQVIKEYIRRAKSWRNREWRREDDGRPKSYLMSLLVVRAYEISGHEGPGGVTRALKHLVKNHETMNVYWADKDSDFYKRSDYPNLLPSRPRLVDPANPANNVWMSGFSGDHSVLVRKIDTIDLSQPV